MKLDCTTDQYGPLYARWLVDPGKLLDLAGLRPGDRVIDLCGGTGIVAKEAVKRGAKSAFVVDLNPGRMYDGTPDDMRIIPPFWGRAEDVDELLQSHVEGLHGLPRDVGNLHVPGGCLGERCRCHRYKPDFDLVVCRQAIGYLGIKQTARAVANILRPGGKFVFNAFKRPKFTLKSYTFNGKRFFEASGFLGRTVWHVQAAPSIGVDVTKFKWHTEDELDAALRPYFEIARSSTEKSLYFVCTKRRS